MRIVVAGGRDFTDWQLFCKEMDRVTERYPGAELVSGHAAGADQMAERFAAERGFPVQVFPADWSRFGRSAGIQRNRQMLEYASLEDCLLVAFWDGKSRGTKNSIETARRMKISTLIIPY